MLLNNAPKRVTTPEGAAVVGTNKGWAGLSPGAPRPPHTHRRNNQDPTARSCHREHHTGSRTRLAHQPASEGHPKLQVTRRRKASPEVVTSSHGHPCTGQLRSAARMPRSAAQCRCTRRQPPSPVDAAHGSGRRSAGNRKGSPLHICTTTRGGWRAQPHAPPDLVRIRGQQRPHRPATHATTQSPPEVAAKNTLARRPR